MAEPWDFCDCWVSGLRPADYRGGGLVPCGCGCGDPVRLYRDEDVIHWRGAHWRLGCAFGRALAELGEQRRLNLALAERCRGQSEILTAAAGRAG